MGVQRPTNHSSSSAQQAYHISPIRISPEGNDHDSIAISSKSDPIGEIKHGMGVCCKSRKYNKSF